MPRANNAPRLIWMLAGMINLFHSKQNSPVMDTIYLLKVKSYIWKIEPRIKKNDEEGPGLTPGPLFYRYGLLLSFHPLLVLCQR